MFPAQRPGAAQPSAGPYWTVTLGAGVVLSIGLLAATSAPLMGAEPTSAEPSPLLIDPLDPRAEGEGPGLVGDPLLALAFVLALGLLAAGGAVLFARLAGRR